MNRPATLFGTSPSSEPVRGDDAGDNRGEHLGGMAGALVADAAVGVGSRVISREGHVPGRWGQRLVTEVSRRIRGLRRRRDQLLADEDLESRVARAMADDTQTCAYVIEVHARDGIVHLRGAIVGTELSPDILAAAQEIAANVLGVRSAIVDAPTTSEDVRFAVEPGTTRGRASCR